MRDELRRILDRPAEVNHARRVGHLAVLSILLFVSVGILLGFATLTPLVTEMSNITRDTQLLSDLEQVGPRDLVLALIQPDLGMRLTGLALHADDAKLDERLRSQIERERQRRDARLELMSAPIRNRFRVPEDVVDATPPDELLNRDVRNEVRSALDPSFLAEHEVTIVQWGLLLSGPIVWIVWAFLTRGGLSYRFFGLELIRDDGRKAARWQCVIRAMVFWAPLLVLWGASIWLDQYYWSRWHDVGFRGSFKWMTLASWLAWWAAAVLLVAYFVMAAWQPARSRHDRIAGTWLMPR
jgi:hypothetical protein